MMILAMMLAIAVSANAMSYKEAKRQALFLADKMAYELDLTDEQYEAAYEVNLDYLMAVNHRDHLFGTPWASRNTLFRTILAPWQYEAYVRANHFYRPLYWRNNAWHWHIYSRYGATRYFRRRPAAFVSYRGGRPMAYYQHRSWHHPMRHGRVHRDTYIDHRPSRRHAHRYDDRHAPRYEGPRMDRHDNHRWDRRHERDIRKMERQERRHHDNDMYDIPRRR